jgi:site-specific DNA recombinase
MRIAIYSRVSTSHQIEHQTIEQQLDRLVAHVRMHAADGWVLDPTHVFRDEGYSGAMLARPGLDRLRDAVKGREIDRVLVTTPDRLARNYVHQMVLLEEWTRAGCLVEFLDRPMSDDPHDHLLLQIRGAVAEYERTLIAERMRRGRLAKLRAGVLLPWTYPPYGYRLDPDRPRDPQGVTTDPAEAAIVAELFALYREPGTSLMQLARHLDRRGVPTPSGRPRWSSPTIRGILRNPTYTGQVYAQRTRYRAPTHRRSATHAIGRPHGTATPLPAEAWLLVGQVPALVSQAHFDEVQAKLASNRSFARRNNTAHQYLLRALVSCGCCGLACTARAVNGRSFYYICNGKGQSTYSHRATRCSARYIPAKQLDELVWQDLCALLSEPAPLAAAVARAHGGAWLPQELIARRETLRRGQAHLRQQIERLTDAYLRAIIPLEEYERRRSDLERRLQALAGQEELLRSDAARQQELAGVAASLEAFRARVQHGLAEADFEQRRQLVMLLIDRVVVTDADVEIRYVLPITPESEHVRFCQLRKDYFDHPAPRLGADMANPFTRLFATPGQMQGKAEFVRQLAHLVVIVAFVHTQVLGCFRRGLRPVNGDRLDGLTHQLVIVAIGAGGDDGERDASSVRQQRALHPPLAAIRWVGAGFFPTQRRLSHGPVECQPTPIDAGEFVIGQQTLVPEGGEDPRRRPFLEAPMGRGGRADASRVQGIPLTAGAQHEEDRVHRLAVRHPRVVTAQRMVRPRRQQRFHLLPQHIRQAPTVIADRRPRLLSLRLLHDP